MVSNSQKSFFIGLLMCGAYQSKHLCKSSSPTTPTQRASYLLGHHEAFDADTKVAIFVISWFIAQNHAILDEQTIWVQSEREQLHIYISYVNNRFTDGINCNQNIRLTTPFS